MAACFECRNLRLHRETRKVTIKRLLLVVLACLPVLGCGTVIRPASYPQIQKYFQVVDARAALVLSKDIQGYTYKGNPSSMTGALQTYEFQLGGVLSEALKEGVSSAFANVTVLPQRPADVSGYDLVIAPRVANFDFAINDDGGLAKSFLFGAFGAAATGYSSDVMIRLQADVSDGKGRSLGIFSGNGQGSKPAGTFTWKMSDFNESAGAAVSTAVAKLVGEISTAYQKMRLKGPS